MRSKAKRVPLTLESRSALPWLGDLTAEEISQIQGVVDQAGRPHYVVGSAAEGLRPSFSDIDYTPEQPL